jgi:hypothetical protein
MWQKSPPHLFLSGINLCNLCGTACGLIFWYRKAILVASACLLLQQ